MMETFEHAVGPEKYELIAKQQGNDVSILPVWYPLVIYGTR